MSDKDRIEKVHQALMAFETENDLMLAGAVLRLRKMVNDLIDGEMISSAEIDKLDSAFRRSEKICGEWAKIIHPDMEYLWR